MMMQHISLAIPEQIGKNRYRKVELMGLEFIKNINTQDEFIIKIFAGEYTENGFLDF